jgi:hypothetical protein
MQRCQASGKYLAALSSRPRQASEREGGYIIQLCAVIHEPVSSMDVKYEIFQAVLFAESSKYRELAFMIGRAVENYNPIIASVEVFELFDILAETVDFSEVGDYDVDSFQ